MRPSCIFTLLVPRRALTAQTLIAVLVVAVFAGAAVAQQCSPATGGTPCETAGGVASLGDPDGSDLTVGNPIHPVTGNKYQEELDAAPLPGTNGLEILRHYNSSYVVTDSAWGRGWTLSYDTRVYRTGSSVQIVQADGRRLIFALPNAAGTASADGACAPAAPGQGRLHIEGDGYRWVWPQERELLFDAQGGLVQIRPIGGTVKESVRIDRDVDGRITAVTDPAGRRMELSYDESGHLSGIQHPLGHWRYRVDVVGRVESVQAPNGVTRHYRYEDIGHRSRFTSISVVAPGEKEQVVGQWRHDNEGRAVSYRRADGSEIQLLFNESPDGERISTLTNALGGRTEFRAAEIAGRWRVTQIRGPGCAECGPTGIRMRYDRQGGLVARWRIGGDGLEFRRDWQARVVQVFALRDSKGSDQPVRGELLRRLDYPDHEARWPSVVTRPSVVAGKEASLSIERDSRGNVLSVTQSGYAPATKRGDPEPVAITRTIRMHREFVSGRWLLTAVDGPLPNGPSGDSTDSDVTVFRYAANGQLDSVVSPDGSIRRFEASDAGGRPITIVDRDGYREVVRETEYNLRGEPVAQALTGWLLDRRGQRLHESIMRQRVQRDFDWQGRVTRLVDAAGRETRFDYDANGRPSGVRDARGYRSAVTRDAEGQVRIIALHEPDVEEPLRATYFGRDTQGALRSLLLPDGRQFHLHHDTAGHAIGFTDPDQILHLAMPAVGPFSAAVANRSPDRTLAAVPDSGGSDLVDDFGRVVLRDSSDHGRKTLSYDAGDRLVEMVDATGSRTTYRYDAAGRLLASDIVGSMPAASTTGPPPVDVVPGGVVYTYEGRYLIAVDDPAQRTRYDRDALGRIERSVISLVGLAGGPKILSTVRDRVTGLVTEMGLADGQSFRLDRGSAAIGGNLRRITLRSDFWTDASAILRRWLPAVLARRAEELLPVTVVADDIDVHPFNGVTGLRHGNGVELTRRFDLAGRTTALRSANAGSVVTDWRYGYAAGPRIRTIDTTGQWQRQASGIIGFQHFDYDPGGRLRTPGDVGLQPRISQTTMTTGSDTSAMSDAPSLEKDAAGRIVRDARFRYAYTPAGRLAAVREAANGGLVASYSYNHLGQRTRKTVHDDAGGVVADVYFLWHEGRLVAEIAPDGRVDVQYLSLNDGRRILPVAKLKHSATAVERSRMKLRRAGAGQGRKVTILAIHADHRGAPVAMTDARGQVVWRATVAPSGFSTVEVLRKGVELNLRLPGQYLDAETGLHDNWHRTYDPRSGRYMQPDPLGYPDGPDPYRYAGGDPINRIDPLGLYEIDVHYYMTFFLGVTAGLDPQEARIVALAAQYVDNNPLTRPIDGSSLGSTIGSVLRNQQQLLRYHFVLSGVDGRTSGQYRNANLTHLDSPQLRDLIAASSSSAVGRNGSLQFLGEYLHALADTYSHRDASNLPYDALVANCGLGHGHALHEPDLTYDDIVESSNPFAEGQPPPRETWQRETRTLEMELTLHRILLGYGDPAKSRPPQEIEAVLRAFNAIREHEVASAAGVAGATRDFAGKLEVLQRGLLQFGYGQINMTSIADFAYDVQKAASNRQKYLRSNSGAPLTEEEFPGVCLEGGGRCAGR